MSSEKLKGWVKFFYIGKQYGFIVYGEEDENEIYFSGNNVTSEGWVPKQGHGCRFIKDMGRRGPIAINVTKDGKV